MDKQTKSNLKVGLISLIIMGAIMFGIYALQGRSKGHSHGDGAVHSH